MSDEKPETLDIDRIEAIVLTYGTASKADQERVLAEVRKLREENERLLDQMVTETECDRVIEAERDALRERVTTLEAAIRRYGAHLDECDAVDAASNAPCSCGLRALKPAPTNQQAGEPVSGKKGMGE